MAILQKGIIRISSKRLRYYFNYFTPPACPFRKQALAIPGTIYRRTDYSTLQVHLFSSTASFTLLSPLPSSTLYITSINATAFYEHDKPVGRIQHDMPFAVPPGSSETPRLPVDLDLGGAGYDALKKALGGTLKLDTAAEVRAKLGEYAEVLAFEGRQIGTKVRP